MKITLEGRVGFLVKDMSSGFPFLFNNRVYIRVDEYFIVFEIGKDNPIILRRDTFSDTFFNEYVTLINIKELVISQIKVNP